MNVSLKLKHWQLFLIILLLPIFCVLIFQIALFSEMVEQTNGFLSTSPPTHFFPSTLKWFPLIILASSFPVFGWQWSIGTTMHRYLPQGVTMNLVRFKAFIIIPFAYFGLFSLWMTSMFYGFEEIATHPNPLSIPPKFFSFFAGFIVMIPLHLFSIFCMVHTIRFCTKALKSVELEREAHFGDYIGEFFLLWFNIVGIWILQPRIQKIIEQSPMHIDDLDDATVVQKKEIESTESNQIADIPEKPLNFKPDGDPFEHDDDFSGIL